MSLDSLGVGSSCSLQPLGGRVFGSQQQQQSQTHLPLSLQVGASGRLRSPSYGNPRASAWMNLFRGAHALWISYLLRKQAWRFQGPDLSLSPEIRHHLRPLPTSPTQGR